MQQYLGDEVLEEFELIHLKTVPQFGEFSKIATFGKNSALRLLGVPFLGFAVIVESNVANSIRNRLDAQATVRFLLWKQRGFLRGDHAQ